MTDSEPTCALAPLQSSDNPVSTTTKPVIVFALFRHHPTSSPELLGLFASKPAADAQAAKYQDSLEVRKFELRP